MIPPRHPGRPRLRHPGGRELGPLHARSWRLLRRVALAAWGALCGAPLLAAAQAGGSAPDSTHLPDWDAPEAFVHESWTVQEGLPVNSVNALLQSRDGYLWIATFDGLVRFDGVRFTVFNSSNSEGLPSNRILDLHEARDGSLWLGTEQFQLVRYQDGAFTHFGPERGVMHAVWTLHEDASGTLWVGTEQGLGFIGGERFEPVAPETIRDRVQAILRRRDGTVWAGTAAEGLYRIEEGQTVRVARRAELDAAEVTALHEGPDGRLWIGTAAGVWREQAPRASLERVLRVEDVLGFHAAPHSGETWVLTPSRTLRLAADGSARALERMDAPVRTAFRPSVMLPDADGRMLYPSGPHLYREGRRIHTIAPDADGPHGVHQRITALALDHEGSLWLGTFAAGLYRLKPSLFTIYSEAEGLSHRNVYPVYEDRAGAVWIGTLGGGVNRLEAGRISRLPAERGFPGAVRSILQDRAGRLWLGRGDLSGVVVCAPPAARCAPPVADPIGASPVLAMHEEASGALWFGTGSGLVRYAHGRWHRLGEAEGAPALPARVFAQTSDGALWVGTNGGGLARYHRERFTHVTTAEGLPIDLIRSLHEDADGWLWIGTEGRGLARLDPREWQEGRGGRIVSYRTADGLFDEVIHQILEDDFGRLWMSSNRGIFWVERAELLAFAEGKVARIHSIAYTERDGLRNREANGGSQPAGVKTRDGRLWFPTQDGVAVVDPARIQQNRIPPNVVIEQVTAGGAALRPGGGGALPLKLGVEQRDLEIEYTALSFLAPANVHFRYRLEPYDGDWVEAGSRRTAYYTRVPSGRYTFRVLASNNDGVWNEEGAALELHLQPYFHETGAFRLLFLLLVALLLAGGVGWRVHSLRKRTRELARLVDERTAELRAREGQLEAQAEQLQELDRAKSHFFANVSHEFRTPLTLILGPLRDLAAGRHGRLPEVLRPQVEMMTRNGRRLQRLVNQVLDLAKLESHSLSLSTEPRDLVELARTTTRSFTPLAERRGIALHFHAPEEPLPVQMDAEQLEKVLLNLLSNACKFTEPGGEVTVALYREEDEAVLAVGDTGIGIAPEQLPRVFERFYQADSTATRRHEGTGIGLSLVKELVGLHGGQVSAESEPGEGSSFVVRLPLGPPLPDPLPPAPPLPRVGASAHGRIGDELPAISPMRRFADAPVRDRGPGERAREPTEEEPDRTTVLVVDDHADIRAYVRTVLEPTFRVLEAADGQEGLERAREALPDLVIADVMMPRLDGLGLVRGLRADAATDCIPIILLTARAAPGHEVEGLGTGVDDYVTKPFDASVLEARVGNLIASRRRLRERFRLEGLPAPAPAPEPARARSELEERLRGIVEANLTDPDFDHEALAAAAGLSYKQLYRRLAAELEATPSQFIRGLRAERAAQLLRDGAGSVTEVAYSVGFNSLSHFHRCYRERFGTAPTSSLTTPA